MAWFFAAAALTIAVECPVLALLGYRRRLLLVVCALVNGVSNLTLNLALSFVPRAEYQAALLAAETLVVLVEWVVLRRAILVSGQPSPTPGWSGWRLLACVALANATSFLVGALI
ncbi:MAG: hypothetical protein LBV00_04510, partial [Propionibacteriaceae bacterium]|nr:hypothetical protein [Propionibacteriaceae bacterium]